MITVVSKWLCKEFKKLRYLLDKIFLLPTLKCWIFYVTTINVIISMKLGYPMYNDFLMLVFMYPHDFLSALCL